MARGRFGGPPGVLEAQWPREGPLGLDNIIYLLLEIALL